MCVCIYNLYASSTAAIICTASVVVVVAAAISCAFISGRIETCSSELIYNRINSMQMLANKHSVCIRIHIVEKFFFLPTSLAPTFVYIYFTFFSDLLSERKMSKEKIIAEKVFE